MINHDFISFFKGLSFSTMTYFDLFSLTKVEVFGPQWEWFSPSEFPCSFVPHYNAAIFRQYMKKIPLGFLVVFYIVLSSLPHGQYLNMGMVLPEVFAHSHSQWERGF